VHVIQSGGASQSDPGPLLPGEDEALRQSMVAGGPDIKTSKSSKPPSDLASGPSVTSTPAPLKDSTKKSAQQVCVLCLIESA
jgi:hypothetical protein